MEELSKQDESRILGALERAIGMTNDGSHPTEAIQKVAEEGKFTPPMIQRMAEAYNVSKMINHLGHVKGAARADTFPIASAEKVIESMYPANPETAATKAAATYVPSEVRPERINFNKVANKLSDLIADSAFNKKVEPYAVDPATAEKRSFAKLAQAKKAEDEAMSVMRRHYFELMGLAKQAASQFRFLSHRPFAEVEQDIVAAHGSMGKLAMDLVYNWGNLTEKRAKVDESHRAFFKPNEHPYRTVLAMIKESQEMARAASDAAKANLAYRELESRVGTPKRMTKEAVKRSLDSILGDDSDEDDFVKEAVEAVPSVPFVHQNVIDSMKNIAGIGMSMSGVKPRPYEDIKEEVSQEMADPVHESKMQGIRTQAILNDFISNDPVLSTYPPHEVAKAYNSVADLSPGVSQQPAVLRGVLRRMMQQEGVIEPFEAQQLTSVDKYLRGSSGQETRAPEGAK